LCLGSGIEARAQSGRGPAVLTLPATGTFEKGGDFTGTISINRFEQRGDQIVAVGLLSGVLSQGSRRIGTVVVGELAWPVALRSGGQSIANIDAHGIAPTPRRVAWSPAGPAFRTLPVQAAGCQVLDIALGPLDVNALGVQVSLGAVAFDLTGASGPPLGDLVCAVSGLL